MTIEEAVKQAKSYGEVMVLLGYKSRGGNKYQKLRKEIETIGNEEIEDGEENS